MSSQSPSAPKPQSAMLSFAEILPGLHSGRLYSRQGWGDTSIHVAVVDDFLCIRGADDDGLYHPLKLHRGDLFVSDWIEVSAEARSNVAGGGDDF